MNATIAAAAQTLVIVDRRPESRRRARVIGDSDIRRMAGEVRNRALDHGAWAHDAMHAGSVPNCYGYPASTDGMLAVSDPDGRVVVWILTLPANKVTLSGVVGGCVPGAHPLYDLRFGREADLRAEAVIQAAHAAAIEDNAR